MTALRDAKIFKGLPDKELKSIEKELKTISQPAGHDIVVKGGSGVGFMILLEGTATATLASGKQRKLGPGDSFGEMALLDHEGRSATIRADTEVTMATIPEWNFKSFLGQHPEVAYRLLVALSQRVRQAEAGT